MQFRNYVNRLRAKTNDYKKKRAALQDLRAETGVLTRTQELLSQQCDELRQEIVRYSLQVFSTEFALQESAGLRFVEEGFTDHVERPKTAAPLSKDIQELRDLLAEIEEQHHNVRQSLESKLAELRPLREQFEVCKLSLLALYFIQYILIAAHGNRVQCHQARL